MGNLQTNGCIRKCIRSKDIHNPLDDTLRAEARKISLASASRFTSLHATALQHRFAAETAAHSSREMWHRWPRSGEDSTEECRVYNEAASMALLGLCRELRVVPTAWNSHAGPSDTTGQEDSLHALLIAVLEAEVEAELREEMEVNWATELTGRNLALRRRLASEALHEVVSHSAATSWQQIATHRRLTGISRVPPSSDRETTLGGAGVVHGGGRVWETLGLRGRPVVEEVESGVEALFSAAHRCTDHATRADTEGSLADLFALERDKALAALGEAFTNALTQSHTASKFDGKEGGGGCVERFAAGGGDKAYRAAWQGVAERGTLSSSMASIEAGIEVAEFLLEVCPSQATIEATASAALALRQTLQEEPLDSGSSGLQWREGACREAVGLVQRELDGDLRHAVDEWGGLRGAAGSGIDALFEAFVGVLRAASLEAGEVFTQAFCSPICRGKNDDMMRTAAAAAGAAAVASFRRGISRAVVRLAVVGCWLLWEASGKAAGAEAAGDVSTSCGVAAEVAHALGLAAATRAGNGAAGGGWRGESGPRVVTI